MSVLRSPAALPAATLLALTACGDPVEPLPLNGDAVLDNGVLAVRGDDGANEIRVTYSVAGVDVERDGDAVRFNEPILAIDISTGPGNDIVRYEQTVVADVALTIGSGEGDDQVLVSLAPSGSGSEMTFPVVVRTGPGSDRLDFRWDGGAAPAVNAYVTLDAESRSHGPEQDDEVLVSFESGDPDRPVIIGHVWNAGAPQDTPPGGDPRSLSLEVDLRAGTADVAFAISGGRGADVVDLDVDYSGVTLQQARISVDADLGEGDNHMGKYIVTSVRHTTVETGIVAGNGDNVLEIESVLGGDGEHTYVVELGNGDNETAIGFGDGIRGTRPASGQREVMGSYRSGSGVNAVTLESDVIEPLSSAFTIDFGTGDGTTLGRYKLKFPWDRAAEPGTQIAPSEVSLVLLSPTGSDLDLRIDVGDPDTDEPGAFGVVTATGTAMQETDLQFLHRLAAQGGDAEAMEEWELHASGLTTAGDISLAVDIPPGLERLVYLQDAVDVAGGATMKVALSGHAGADAVLAHLIGLSGGGSFELLADGGAGNDVIATLTRDLDTGGGIEMAFALVGGDGDDTIGLESPTDIVPGTPIGYAITGGSGTDACFASQDVPVTECERLEAVGEELWSLIENLFGPELADVWRK